MWVRTFKRYSPSYFVISGGEPSLVPNIADFVNSMSNTSVHLNTNGEHILRLSEQIVPRNNFLFICSYHPSQHGSRNVLEDAKRVKDKGLDVMIAYITHPSQLEQQEEVRQRCIEYDLLLNYTPCVSGKINTSVRYTKEEASIVSKIIHQDCHKYINYVANERKMMCSGGHDLLAVVPNGDTYRCPLKCLTKREEIIGNILKDKNVLLNEPMTQCDSGICTMCGEQWTKQERL